MIKIMYSFGEFGSDLEAQRKKVDTNVCLTAARKGLFWRLEAVDLCFVT